MTQVEQNSLNQRELRKLILSIRANANRLDLFLAICDDRNLQEALIQQYEAELSQQGFATYRTRLAVKQPSLKAALEALTEREPELRSAEKAVVTVLGGSELLGVRLTEERSEQERFFFSLQWTRESLREFQFPVVVWLSSTVATGLAQQAQDFWSWRSGVFEFESEFSTIAPDLTLEQGLFSQVETETHSTNSIVDLNQQITALEQQNPRSPLLVRLYNDLGDAYQQSYAHEPALQAYEQALNLAQVLKDQAGQAKSFLNLGRTLYNCGRYVQAIDFHELALEIYKTLGDRQGEAISLGSLSYVYHTLGQYQQAIDFHQQALEIAREIGNRQGEAISLTSLGLEYHTLGQYQQAIEFHQQALEIMHQIGNRRGEAISLGNLGLAYHTLGQYQQAVEFHQQHYEIAREIADRKGEADSLNNLGLAYNALRQYQQAIEFHQQALEIMRKIGDRRGEANSLNKLGLAYNALGQYQQAIEFDQQALEIMRKIGDQREEANSLDKLGLAYYILGQYQQAIEFHQQALAIAREIGDRRGEADSLSHMGITLYQLDQHDEALQCYQQALAIYESLKLDHMVEKCQTAIAELNQKHNQPTARQPLKRWQKWGLWFAVGLGIVLLIWWLSQ